MNQRENLLSLLRRKGYAHVPLEFSLCDALVETYKKETGGKKPYSKHFGFPWSMVDDLLLPAGDEKRFRGYFDPPLKEGAHIDVWGVGHEPSPSSMHMTYMRSPLRGVDAPEEMKRYPLPDYARAIGAHQKAQARAIKARGLAAVGNMQCTIWETAWYMRGMEDLMMDMMCGEETAVYILDEVTERAIIRARAFVRAGVDILYLGDDIGMQNTVMMSEELYCHWLKPRLRRVIAAAREINPDIIIFYHTCGFVTPFIPHLIDVGIDVLNPIQSECMDFAEIHREYGKHISFHGTIGTQTTMPFAASRDVKEAVWRNLDIAGERGGLFVAPTHLLEPEVPWENILAYVEACREYK